MNDLSNDDNNTLPEHILRCFEQKKPVAAEIQPPDNEHRTWVSVYKISKNSITARIHPGKKYIVRRVVISREHLQQFEEEGLDLVYEHCTQLERYLVDDENSLISLLNHWIASVDELGDAWKVEYPF